MSIFNRRGRRPSLSCWIAAISLLLILNAVLAFAWVRATLSPPASPKQDPTATASATLQPQRTTEAKLPTPTRRATRTPGPRPTVRPSPLDPSPLATPTVTVPRCMETTGQVMDESFYSRISDSDQAYIVYLPPCYDLAARRYPTLYLMHGSQHDETHWESLGLFQVMNAGIHSGTLAPAIIVLPAGDDNLFLNTSGGPASFEGQIVRELIPVVDSKFLTDPRPEMRAIGGISRGGVWSLEIGFHNPNSFSIVGGHSSCLNLNEAPPEFDPLQMTEQPTLKAQRIWLDAGDTDYCRPGIEALHNALQASSVTHQYQLWPGAHEDALWAAHLADYLAFYTLDWPKP